MRLKYYERPISIEECLQMLSHYGPSGKLLAGGTDVIPRLRQRIWKLDALIDISKIPELTVVNVQDDIISVGACSILSNLVALTHALPGAASELCRAAGHISSIQVRNIATLGGNICNASPSADTVPILVALDSAVTLQGPAGNRELSIEDFMLAPGKTALSPNEILTSVSVPVPSSKTGAKYNKFSIRGDSDIAILGSAARITLGKDGCIQDARIALGGVGPTVYRAKEAEQLLIGNHPDESLFEKAAAAAAEGCAPISDQRATAGYRRQMAAVYTRYSLLDAFKQANSSE